MERIYAKSMLSMNTEVNPDEKASNSVNLNNLAIGSDVEKSDSVEEKEIRLNKAMENIRRFIRSIDISTL